MPSGPERLGKMCDYVFETIKTGTQTMAAKAINLRELKAQEKNFGMPNVFSNEQKWPKQAMLGPRRPVELPKAPEPPKPKYRFNQDRRRVHKSQGAADQSPIEQ